MSSPVYGTSPESSGRAIGLAQLEMFNTEPVSATFKAVLHIIGRGSGTKLHCGDDGDVVYNDPCEPYFSVGGITVHIPEMISRWSQSSKSYWKLTAAFYYTISSFKPENNPEFAKTYKILLIAMLVLRRSYQGSDERKDDVSDKLLNHHVRLIRESLQNQLGTADGYSIQIGPEQVYVRYSKDHYTENDRFLIMSKTLNKIMTTVYPDFWTDFDKEWEDPTRRNLMLKTTDSVVGMISRRAVQAFANNDFIRLLGVCDLERRTLEQKVLQEFKDGSESRRLSSSSLDRRNSVNSAPFQGAGAGTPPSLSFSPVCEGIQQPASQTSYPAGAPSAPIPIPSGNGDGKFNENSCGD